MAEDGDGEFRASEGRWGSKTVALVRLAGGRFDWVGRDVSSCGNYECNRRRCSRFEKWFGLLVIPGPYEAAIL